jgi:hypothetical protein
MNGSRLENALMVGPFNQQSKNRQSTIACTKKQRRSKLRLQVSRVYSDAVSSARMYSTTDSLQPSMCVHLP